ncbi:ribosome-inactivating family protein [Streptomyces brasiliscabiei]|uniref:Ribosome-inactivating family protein n=1 Tax=Streptomyces brasiliscabiei TaxID=2736302 RepID=A0ABU8G3K2_9ACTN
MPTLTVRRLAATAAVPAMLAGAVLLSGTSAGHSADSTAGAAKTAQLDAGKIELSASHQIYWDLDDGPDGAESYKNLIRDLRDQARTSAGATRRFVRDANGTTRAVDTTDSARDNEFADIIIRPVTGSPLHARIRLSNMYVVQFYYVRGDGKTVNFNLAPDMGSGSGHTESGIPEGYDALSGRNWANRPLTSVTLGHDAFHSAVAALRNPAADQQAWGRAMQTFIIGISEGARFGPISLNVYKAMRNFGQYTLTDQDVHAMHNWSRMSQIYRNDGASSSTSPTVYGRTINSARTAALFLLEALGGPTAKDEL